MWRGIFLMISEPGNLHGQGQRWKQHFGSLLISMSEAVLGIRVQLLNLKMALLSNKWHPQRKVANYKCIFKINAGIYSALTGTKYEVSYILYIHFFFIWFESCGCLEKANILLPFRIIFSKCLTLIYIENTSCREDERMHIGGISTLFSCRASNNSALATNLWSH